MKSFQSFLSEVRHPVQLSFPFVKKEPSGSQLNKEQGEMYEILTAAHINRHLSGQDDLGQHHFSQHADQHLSGSSDNTFSRSEELKRKHPKKWDEINQHARSDAESFVSHLKNNGYGDMLSHPDTRVVHTPSKPSIRRVISGDTSSGPMSSNADIVLTNKTLGKHVGVDTKLGGSVTLKANTRKSILGVLKRGYNLTKRKADVESLYDDLESGKAKDEDRTKIMTQIAQHHANAFNAMSRGERARAAANITNSGTDDDMRTFRMHRKKSGVSIVEPSEEFKRKTAGVSEYRAAVSGRGFDVYGVKGTGAEPLSRAGMKQTGKGTSRSARSVIANVKIKRKTSKGVEREEASRQKFQQRVRELRARRQPSKVKYKVRKRLNV